MKRIAVYGIETNEKQTIMAELRALNRMNVISSNSSVNSFKLFDDGREPPYHTAAFQILVLDLNKESMESLASLQKNYFPCSFDRPLMLLVYGEDKSLLKELDTYINSHVILHRISHHEKIPSEAILNALENLGQQFYKPQGVFSS